MKKNVLKRYVAWAVLAAAWGATAGSCIKDDETGRTTATVQLSVSTRADDSDQTDNGGKELADNEEMKTLRVIVARATTGEVLYNVYEDKIADDDYQRTFTFSELTIQEEGENFDFYAIANEAGFLSGDESLEQITTDELVKLHSNKILDKLFGTNDLIPQTKYQRIHVEPQDGGGMQSETIQLEFVVAKVNVRFINETGEPQTICALTLQASNPGKGYLFEHESDVPDNVTYQDVLIAEQISVPANANGESLATAYLYPGHSNEEKAYVLKGSWNGKDYQVDAVTITSGSLVQSLERSNQLDITITLIGGKRHYSFNALVNSWGEKNMIIPPFK